jgi:hypothetical protein
MFSLTLYIFILIILKIIAYNANNRIINNFINHFAPASMFNFSVYSSLL